MKTNILKILSMAFCLFALMGDYCDTDDDDDDDDDTVDPNLIWQDPPSTESMLWEQALSYCQKSTFDGYDDWRLPTISELRSLIEGCEDSELGGDCDVDDGCLTFDCRDDTCFGCSEYGGPGIDGAYWSSNLSGPVDKYWSSSATSDNPNFAWLVQFVNAYVANITIDDDAFARCVRP